MQATRSSGKKSADGIISNRPSLLTGVLIITNGINDAKVIIYNSQDTSGPILFEATVAGANLFGGATYEIPVIADGDIIRISITPH